MEQDASQPPAPVRKQSSIIQDLRDSFLSMRHRWWRYGAMLAFLFCLSGWIAGLRQAGSDSPLQTAVRDRLGLQNIECVALGDSWAVFEAALDEAVKQRWASRWDMKLLRPEAPPVVLPSIAMLREWQAQDDIYVAEDVERWRQRYLLEINHGYHRQWDDGSIMLLDLQGNRLIGVVSADWAASK